MRKCMAIGLGLVLVAACASIVPIRAQEGEDDPNRPDESDAVRTLRQLDFADSVTGNDPLVTGIPSLTALQDYRDGFNDIFVPDPSEWTEDIPSQGLLDDWNDAMEVDEVKFNRVAGRVSVLLNVDFKPLVGEEGEEPETWTPPSSLRARLAFLDTRTYKLSEKMLEDWEEEIRPQIEHKINTCHGLVFSMEAQVYNILEDISLAEDYRRTYYGFLGEPGSFDSFDYYSMYLTHENIKVMSTGLIDESLTVRHGWTEFYEHYDEADGLLSQWFRWMDDLPDLDDY